MRCHWPYWSSITSVSCTRIRRRSNFVNGCATKYRSELTVLLSDHIQGLDKTDTASTVSLLTGQRGEPFYLHVMPLDASGTDVAVSVRETRHVDGRLPDPVSLVKA